MKRLNIIIFLVTFNCMSMLAQSNDIEQQTDDVNIIGNKREYIHLKGYYRCYQENDSALKYYRDGIVDYYVRCKDGDIDIFATAERYLRNEKAYRKGGKNTFDLSDNMTARPIPEKKTLLEKSDGRYTLVGDSAKQDIMLGTCSVGSLIKDKVADITTMNVDLLAPKKNKKISLFGKTCILEQNQQTETYKYDYEYESLKNLRQLRSICSYRFDYDKKGISQRITTVSELYVFETEYVSKAEKKSQQRNVHNDINTITAAKAINDAMDNRIAPVDISALWYYNPANLNKSMPQQLEI